MTPKRKPIDQEISERTQVFVKQLLEEIPELDGVAVVFSWRLGETAGLPGGFWQIQESNPLRIVPALMVQAAKMVGELTQHIQQTLLQLMQNRGKEQNKNENDEPNGSI